MRLRTYFIETWGCQMNHHDSERMEDLLLRRGLEPADSAGEADLVLLNTCSVREKPVQKILTRIGQLARLERRPAVGVCGCVAQQEGERLLARSKTVRFVLSPGRLESLHLVLEAVERGERAALTGFEDAAPAHPYTGFRSTLIRAMVTVSEGCNEFCTFCVVPYTRGRELSRPAATILEEVRHLLDSGATEIELLGQTVNSYRCPETGIPFARLLDEVASLPGVLRLRFITSHPRYFDDELIEVMARHPHLSRYLHLPFQAGSNRVLEAMHRRYTREEYLDLIRRLREAIPEVNLSTDVIVGFPGESDGDFEQTLELLEEVRFGQVFAFAYSPRPRTPAARYEAQVPEPVKKERLQRLFQLTDAISQELHQALVGTVQEVLVDGPSRRSAEDWQGRTPDNRVVNFRALAGQRPGQVVPVRILRASAHSLYGETVQSISQPVSPGSAAPELPVL